MSTVGAPLSPRIGIDTIIGGASANSGPAIDHYIMVYSAVVP